MRATVLLCAGMVLNGVVASVGVTNKTGIATTCNPFHCSSASISRRDDGDGDDDGGDDGEYGGDPDQYDDGLDEYLYDVCYGESDDDDYDTIDITNPCRAFQVLDMECYNFGDSEPYYLENQECICGAGSMYFDMMSGCNNCFKVHGGIELDYWYPTAVISSASAAFCTGTPTAAFTDYFESILETQTGAYSSAIDQFPSQTAVSDYYTGVIGTQAGAITGSFSFTTTPPYMTETSALPTITSVDSFGLHGSVTAGLASAQTGAATKTGANGTATSSGASASATGNSASDIKSVSGMLSVIVGILGIICVL